MFKRKNILSMLLLFVLTLSNTIAFAQETLPQDPLAEEQIDSMGGGLAIPYRNASSWALNELVDSDRYGLYNRDDLYKGDLKNLLDDELRQSLLENFTQRLEESSLEKVEKPELLTEVNNPKTRGGFVRELYNILVAYEDQANLGKDPIMHMNHIKIITGNGNKLHLDKNITIEEAILFTKRSIDYIYKENDLESKGLMWKVENKGNVVYLLGSIHYGKPGLYPFRSEILSNFDDSEKLYVEVDITNEEELMKAMMEKMAELQAEMEKNSKYDDGTTLESVIDEKLFSKVEVIMNKHGIAKEEYENLKIQGIEEKLNEIIMNKVFEDLPDFNEEELEQDLEGLEDLEDNELMKILIEGPKLGVDYYFIDKAKVLDKEVGELESIKSQMELLFGGGLFQDPWDDMSDEEKIERLQELLENFDKEGNILDTELEIEEPLDENFEEEMNLILEEQLNMIEDMFTAIKTGDADKLAELFMESGEADMLGGQLLGERDKNMAKKIANMLEGNEDKTYFIVVGAAHFVVEGTILDNLTEMGYTVESLNKKN